MERFKLNIPTAMPQQIHHQLKILWIRYILGHYIEVTSIKQ